MPAGNEVMEYEIVVRVFRSRAELERLVPEWEALLMKSDVGSPFLSPGWQFAWLETYGAGRDLFALEARVAGNLVGLWPLARRRCAPGFRVLEPVGAGRSDWLDVLVLPEHREAVLAAFLKELQRWRREWDLLELRDVLEDSPAIGALERLGTAAGLSVRRSIRTVAPYLAARGSWELYLSSKSANFRSSLKRRIKKAAGPVTIALLQAPDPRRLVRDFAEVERRSWKEQEGTRKLTTEVGREFYRRFCEYFSAKDWLRIWTASADGSMIAYLVNFEFAGKTYYYNGAYDERVSDLSPGTVLHAAAIEDTFRRQLAEYDFLSGDEGYKDRWATDRRHIHHIVVSSSRPVSVAARALLVDLRWAARRSKRLRAARARVLTLTRRISRGGARQGAGSDS
jgi:CelD/BcsL family acetyltransferase involved in cellulose biosynthesis